MPCEVRYVACHAQVASLLSFVSGVPIGALLVVLQQYFLLRLLVARFWLAEVGSCVRCSST